MKTGRSAPFSTAVLGAGLTGLSAAFVLSRGGVPVQVLEATQWVGGASRTVSYDGFRFDLGGHRLHTENSAVLDLVRELLGDELTTVRRSSHIHFAGRYVDYPLTFFNALSALGTLGALSVAASYGAQRIRGAFGNSPEGNLEDWLVGRFGRKLYEIYFKPYSEKVWGVPCTALKSDFADERIKGLSFREAVRNMIVPRRRPSHTLISRFLYPRLGFGRITESMAASLPSGSVKLRAPVSRVEHDGRRVVRVVYLEDGRESACAPDQVVSTIPISDLVNMLSPAAPAAVQEAASGLRYRDLIIVFLALNVERVTADHWIYFPGKDVFFGRLHEPKNWSPAMAPSDKTGLAVDVFCFDHDAVWCESDESLIDRTAHRLTELGLVKENILEGGCVVRVPKAYPLYIGDYRRRLDRVIAFLRRLENLQAVGRNGLFRYTGGDHCIEMGIKAAQGLLRRNVTSKRPVGFENND